MLIDYITVCKCLITDVLKTDKMAISMDKTNQHTLFSSYAQSALNSHVHVSSD